MNEDRSVRIQLREKALAVQQREADRVIGRLLEEMDAAAREGKLKIKTEGKLNEVTIAYLEGICELSVTPNPDINGSVLNYTISWQ